MFADVEHLARQQPPLDPPFVEIVQTARILRRAQHELCGLGEFLFAAEQLDLGEDVAGVAVQFVRHRVEQRLEVGGLLVGRDARLRQRDMAASRAAWRRACRRPPARCRRAAMSIRALWSPGVSNAPNRSSAALSVSSDIGSLRQASRTSRSALARSPRAIIDLRQRELALGRDRRFVFEPRPDRGVVAAVVPQRRLDAPAQEGLRRPARIGGDERAIALDRGAVVVAAQDQPFGELARDRIRDRGLRLRGVGGLCLRTSSMTFSSASLSACEVDGRRGYRGRRRLACAEAAGRHAGASRAPEAAALAPVRPAAVVQAAAVFAGGLAVVFAAVFAAAVLGTTLRAIGRGFGSGTFGLAQASTGRADSPIASARLVASAVDRNAAARAEGVTAFLCGGESFNRSGLRSI